MASFLLLVIVAPHLKVHVVLTAAAYNNNKVTQPFLLQHPPMTIVCCSSRSLFVLRATFMINATSTGVEADISDISWSNITMEIVYVTF